MNRTGLRLPFGIPPDLGILAAMNLLWGLGEGLFIYFYPLLLQHWQIDSLQIGAVLSFLGVIMALVQAPAGYLSDRFGTRPVIRAAAILGVIAAAMMAVADSLPFFMAGLIFYTLTGFIVAPLNSYITQVRGSWSTQRGISFVSGSMQLGAIVGPMLGGWIAQTAGLTTIFRYSAGLFLAATIILFFARRPAAPPQEPESSQPRANPLANPRFLGLLAIIVFTIMALSTPQQLSSVYLQDVQHLSLQQIGLTGTFAGIGAAVILFALGNVPAFAGMIAGQLLVGLFCVLMWSGQTALVFYLGYLVVGGSRLYHAMAIAAVRPLVRASELGLAYGLVETANALAMILAPLASGFLYQFQAQSMYWVSLIVLAIMISLTVGWHYQSAKR